MAELDVSTAPEDTMLPLKYPYFLIMARKP